MGAGSAALIPLRSSAVFTQVPRPVSPDLFQGLLLPWQREHVATTSEDDAIWAEVGFWSYACPSKGFCLKQKAVRCAQDYSGGRQLGASAQINGM